MVTFSLSFYISEPRFSRKIMCFKSILLFNLKYSFVGELFILIYFFIYGRECFVIYTKLFGSFYSVTVQLGTSPSCYV